MTHIKLISKELIIKEIDLLMCEVYGLVPKLAEGI